jgi:protease-4
MPITSSIAAACGRKLTFWRVVAVLLVVGAIAVLASLTSRDMGLSDVASGSVARIKITGLIRGDQDRTEALERLGKSSVRAVIVHIDSPGGTTAGAEQLYDSLVQLKAKKPMVVVIDGLAASGGYIAALSSTTSSRRAHRSSARSASCSSIPTCPIS